MSLPLPSLLNEYGQPCGEKIAARVEAETASFRREHPDTHARRRQGAKSCAVALAAYQAARFGRTTEEVRILDIDDQLRALEYDGYRTRDAIAIERHDLRTERARLEDHVRATLTAPAATVLPRAA